MIKQQIATVSKKRHRAAGKQGRKGRFETKTFPRVVEIKKVPKKIVPKNWGQASMGP